MGACTVQRIRLNCICSCEVKAQDLKVWRLGCSCLLSVMASVLSGGLGAAIVTILHPCQSWLLGGHSLGTSREFLAWPSDKTKSAAS